MRERTPAPHLRADYLLLDACALLTASGGSQPAPGAPGQGSTDAAPDGSGGSDQAQLSTQGGQAAAGAGKQGGAGAGVGTTDPFADQPARLDTAGQRVQVPTRLGPGPGVRPADGTEDQSTGDPTLGGQSINEMAQAQQTGQVASEQNLVPGEQRPVVRGYFK